MKTIWKVFEIYIHWSSDHLNFQHFNADSLHEYLRPRGRCYNAGISYQVFMQFRSFQFQGLFTWILCQPIFGVSRPWSNFWSRHTLLSGDQLSGAKIAQNHITHRLLKTHIKQILNTYQTNTKHILNTQVSQIQTIKGTCESGAVFFESGKSSCYHLDLFSLALYEI